MTAATQGAAHPHWEKLGFRVFSDISTCGKLEPGFELPTIRFFNSEPALPTEPQL